MAQSDVTGLDPGAKAEAGAPANDAPYRQLIDVSFGEDVVVYAFANLYGCRIDSHTRVGAFVDAGCRRASRWGRPARSRVTP